MALSFKDLDFRIEVPDVPGVAPVATLDAPCLRDREPVVKGLARALGVDISATVDLPYGYAVGGANGQVEVFSASGAVRGRNTDQIARFDDERRRWADVETVETAEGTSHQLSAGAANRLTRSALALLDTVGLAGEHASVTVSLGQWAQLNEDGKEVDSGPGRATVKLGYTAGGLALIGPGAKTNMHYDPDSDGVDAVLARFFHVHRAIGGVAEVRTLPLERAFTPLLAQSWAGYSFDPGSTRMSITAAQIGLLALPADVPQRFAAPALMVEGRLEGLDLGDGRPTELRFGQYLPLASPEALAEAGFAASDPVVPGAVGRGRGKRQ